MIRYKTGDILSEGTEALVNTVNCVGVMGRGIALQFKRAYPDNFQAYAARCKRNEIRPGSSLRIRHPRERSTHATSSISRRSATGAARAASRISSPG